MTTVNIKILHSEHQIICEDGKEDRLYDLVNKLNHRMKKLTEQMPKASESKIMLMTSLILEDEISELRKKLSENTTVKQVKSHTDQNLADSFNKIAEYVENLAKKYEKV